MTKKVFLGGTCNNSTWREELIPQLRIEYFNPVVKDWTLEHQTEETKQREICDFVLYTITKEIIGFYSIAEVVDDSNKKPKKTVFCYLEEGFDEFQVQSLKTTASMLEKNGAKIFTSLDKVAKYLNGEEIESKVEILPKNSDL